MSGLTKIEKAWLKKLEKILMNPPSDRIGFYTIGDCDLTAYDRTKEHLFGHDYFCSEVEKHDAYLDQVQAKMPIQATSG